MKEEKQIIRKEIKERLSEITKPLYEHLSYQIAHSLYQDPYWKKANTIGITVSNAPEVDTYQMIRRAWQEGKEVVVPKCHAKTRTMSFHRLTAFNQLETVYSGLYEPIEDQTKEYVQDQIDLLIVPGLGFTREGYRIGFGGGYYDRYLQTYKGKTLSLAFNTQIVSTLPVEQHDIPVAKIITDKETIEIHD